MSGNDVTVQLRGDNKDLNKALDEGRRSFDDYAKYIKSAVVVLGGALAAQKIFSFASDSLEAYQEAEDAENRLTRILKNRGDAIGLNIDQMKQLADSFQAVNAIEADAVVAAEATVAAFKNVNGQQFIDTLQTAADVSAQTGQDFEAMSKQIAQALNDPMKGIRQLRDLGISLSEQQAEQVQAFQESGDYISAQKLLLEELASVYGGSAKDKAGEFASMQKQFGFSIGDAQEALGAIVQDILSLFLPVATDAAVVIKNIATALHDSTGSFDEYRDYIDEYLVGTFEWIVDVGMDTFSWLEFAWKNYTTIVERQTYAWTLTVFGAFEDLKHWFTVAIPGYLTWFANHWGEIFTDIGEYELTVLNNMWDNVVEFFTSLQDWLSGEGGSFEFKSLTEGFQSSISELPKIAERELTGFEKMLQQNIEQYDKQIGQSAEDIFKKNREAIEGLFSEPQELEITPVIKKETIHEAVKKDKDKAKKEADKEETSKATKEDQKKDEDKTSAGVKEDITKLAERIQEAAIKAGETITDVKPVEVSKESQDRMKAVQDKMLELQKSIKETGKDSKESVKLQVELDQMTGADVQKKVIELQQSIKETGKNSQQTAVIQSELDKLTGADNIKEFQAKQKQLRSVNKDSQEAQVLRNEMQEIVQRVYSTKKENTTVEVDETGKPKAKSKAMDDVADAKQQQPKQVQQSNNDAALIVTAINSLYELHQRLLPRIEDAARSAGGVV